MRVRPVVLGHLPAVRAEPGQVLDLRAANLPAKEKLASAQGRVVVKQLDQIASVGQQIALLAIELPIKPARLVVLAIGVVVAVLGPPDLVAAADHRDAL